MIQSNIRVRVLLNCHATNEVTELDRYVKDPDVAEEFEEANLGRRKINTSKLPEDYSLTMNNTDCGAGLGGRLTKYHRKSCRLSQPFLDFFSFEIAAVNAYIMYRGKHPSYKHGIRQFADQIIEETVKAIVSTDPNCWLLRTRKQGFPDQRGRLRERFTNQHVSRLTKIQLRNEMGPVAPDPAIDYTVKLRNVNLKRERAGKCIDFMPTKVEKRNRRKCFVCSSLTQFYCKGEGVKYRHASTRKASMVICSRHAWGRFTRV